MDLAGDLLQPGLEPAQIAAGRLDGGPLVGGLAGAFVQFGLGGEAPFLRRLGSCACGVQIGALALDFGVEAGDGPGRLVTAGLGVLDDLPLSAGGRGKFFQARFQAFDGALDLGGIALEQIPFTFQTAQGRSRFGLSLASRVAGRRQELEGCVNRPSCAC